MNYIVDRHIPRPTEEEHTVDQHNLIFLKELPELKSVEVSGFKEVNCLPHSEDEVFVDYASARLVFHTSATGKSLTVKYRCTGSVLRAKEWNALIDEIEELKAKVAMLEKSCTD